MRLRTILRRTEAIYHKSDCGCNSCKSLLLESVEAIDVEGWVKVMERLAKEVYEGKTDAKIIDEGYILSTYKELNVAAEKGYAKDWIKVNKSTGNVAPEVIELQKNIYKFSGAKSAVVLEQINQILQKQLPWNQFKNEVLKLNPLYNKNYLQAEWQTANQSAKHARDWLYYNENTKLYPNLAYRTQGDERVRDAHSLLNGVVAPINSDFWKTHYPPNGWRCRCYVVQTAETPTLEDKIPKLNDKDFPEEFRINVGITGQIFSEENLKDSKAHPYFALTRNKDWQKAFELSKLSAPANLVYTAKNGATVTVSPFADEKDYKNNISDAKIVADSINVSTEIRAHLEGHKNPEYKTDGIFGDRVEPKTNNVKRGISNAFDDKLKEGKQLRDLDNTFLYINISNYELSNINLDAMINQSWSKFKHYKENIKFIIIIHNNNAIRLDSTLIDKGYNNYRSEFFKIRKGKK